MEGWENRYSIILTVLSIITAVLLLVNLLSTVVSVANVFTATSKAQNVADKLTDVLSLVREERKLRAKLDSLTADNLAVNNKMLRISNAHQFYFQKGGHRDTQEILQQSVNGVVEVLSVLEGSRATYNEAKDVLQSLEKQVDASKSPESSHFYLSLIGLKERLKGYDPKRRNVWKKLCEEAYRYYITYLGLSKSWAEIRRLHERKKDAHVGEGSWRCRADLERNSLLEGTLALWSGQAYVEMANLNKGEPAEAKKYYGKAATEFSRLANDRFARYLHLQVGGITNSIEIYLLTEEYEEALRTAEQALDDYGKNDRDLYRALLFYRMTAKCFTAEFPITVSDEIIQKKGEILSGGPIKDFSAGQLDGLEEKMKGKIKDLQKNLYGLWPVKESPETHACVGLIKKMVALHSPAI